MKPYNAKIELIKKLLKIDFAGIRKETRCEKDDVLQNDSHNTPSSPFSDERLRKARKEYMDLIRNFGKSGFFEKNQKLIDQKYSSNRKTSSTKNHINSLKQTPKSYTGSRANGFKDISTQIDTTVFKNNNPSKENPRELYPSLLSQNSKHVQTDFDHSKLNKTGSRIERSDSALTKSQSTKLPNLVPKSDSVDENLELDTNKKINGK